MDRFEAVARGAYICFRSAGGKPITVKRLWAYPCGKGAKKMLHILNKFPAGHAGVYSHLANLPASWGFEPLYFRGGPEFESSARRSRWCE